MEKQSPRPAFGPSPNDIPPMPANEPVYRLPDDTIEYLEDTRALTVRPDLHPAIITRTRLSPRATLGLIAILTCILGGGFLLRGFFQGGLTPAAALAPPTSSAPLSVAVAPAQPGLRVALPMPPTATPPNQPAVGLPKAAGTLVAADQSTSAAAARVAGGLQPIYAADALLSDGLPTYLCAGHDIASFVTLIQMQVSGRDVAHGFHLGLVPFGLSTETGFDSVARAQADNALRRGDWDCELTSIDQVARVGHGVITALVDSSAGAEGIWSRPSLSTTVGTGVAALRGKRIAYVRQSPAEYFLRYTLTISQINPETGVTLLPFDTVAETVDAYNAGDVDAVAAWQPGVAPLIAAGARPIMTTEPFRAVTHVIATSRYAIETKPELVQAFHVAWFETLKAQVENVPAAANQIVAWGNPQWLGLRANRALNDVRGALLRVAQADLSDNTRVMSRPVDLLDQLNVARGIWTAAGQSVALGSPDALLDTRFVLQVAQQDALVTLRPPVNDSYTSHLPALNGLVKLPTPLALPTNAPLPTPTPSAPATLPAATVSTPIAPPPATPAPPVNADPGQVTLPCRRFDFLPDSAILTEGSRQLLASCVLPALLQHAGARLRLTGSAAWPGPKGTYSEDQIRSLAHARAQAIADYLATQRIDPSRLQVDAVLPPVEHRETDDIVIQSQDRYVEMTLVALNP